MEKSAVTTKPAKKSSMKKSTVHKINHEIADFKDRNRRNDAEVKVHTSVGDAIRESGEFEEDVKRHEDDVAKIQAIRERNFKAYTEGNYRGMTYRFLERVFKFDASEEKAELARQELDRRDQLQAQRQAEVSKLEAKRKQIEDRNHAALICTPMNFQQMTFGLLNRLAKQDEEFIKELQGKGYKVTGFDCIDAGFEVNRRLSARKQKVADLTAKIDEMSSRAAALMEDFKAKGEEALRKESERLMAEVDRLTSELNKIEGVSESKENW